MMAHYVLMKQATLLTLQVAVLRIYDHQRKRIYFKKNLRDPFRQ
jgi:hypothetical protein